MDIEANVDLMMSAGADTTTPLACAILVALLQHPLAIRRLNTEMADAETSGLINRHQVTSWTTIEKLPYFMACVYEAARLYPPVPILLPFAAPPTGLRLPDGRFVPGGTAIGAAAAVINRDPPTFGSDADEWRPERWLGDAESVKRMHKVLFTWGWGARRCIGRQIALAQCCKFVLQVRNSLPSNLEGRLCLIEKLILVAPIIVRH